MNFSKLSPTRKADRRRAADHLRSIARRFEFRTESRETGTDIMVTVEHDCGARASILIDKLSGNNEVVAWNTALDSSWVYPDSFDDQQYGTVNPYHHKKCTRVYPWHLVPAMFQRDCRAVAKHAKRQVGAVVQKG